MVTGPVVIEFFAAVSVLRANQTLQDWQRHNVALLLKHHRMTCWPPCSGLAPDGDRYRRGFRIQD
jgi:hypothetical protein